MRRATVFALLLAWAVPVQALTLHYKTGWTAPRAHYDAGSGWTAAPGKPMVAEGSGWFRIEVPGSSARVAFNDGAGRWDSSGGKNYSVSGAVAWIANGGVYARRPDPGRIVHHARFASAVLRNERSVWVYLPAGYDGVAERYPVLYLNDGNNMFDRNSMFGGWEADASLDQMIAAGEMRPIIAVAVSNTSGRMSEYTPTRDPDYGGGAADEYIRFLTTELKPFVDRTYRTRSEAASTGILGSSLGGLLSFHATWTRSDVFGLCGAMSPSFWWDGEQLLRSVQAFRGTPPGGRFYLDSGDQGPSADGMVQTGAMRDALFAIGYRFGVDLSHYLDRGASHNEIAWRARLPKALAFLFPVVAPAPAPQPVNTIVRIRYDAGWGHRIGLRGTAPGWGSWADELDTSWTNGNVWVYETTSIPAGQAFEFKVVLDGNVWEPGANRAAKGGQTIDLVPRFP